MPSKPLEQIEMDFLLQEDSPVKTSVSEASGVDYLKDRDQNSGSSSIEFCRKYNLSTHSLKTCRASSVVIKEKISQNCSMGWKQSGTLTSPGEYLTLNIGFHSEEKESLYLRDILQPSQDVAPKYYLSSRACAGILRRADKKGRKLPENLRRTLEATVNTTPTVLPTGSEEPKE